MNQNLHLSLLPWKQFQTIRHNSIIEDCIVSQINFNETVRGRKKKKNFMENDFKLFSEAFA